MNRTPDRLIPSTRKIATIRKVKEPSNNDLWVPIEAGGTTIQMFIDSGCDFSIIPLKHYNTQMGKLIENDTNLRAWGASDLLDVKGMIRMNLKTKQGATTNTKVYVVDGFHPEHYWLQKMQLIWAS